MVERDWTFIIQEITVKVKQLKLLKEVFSMQNGANRFLVASRYGWE